MKKQKQVELYLHIPFCQQKCRYCDFLSAPAQEEIKDNYIKVLHEEIKQKSKAYETYSVPSIFIGGGTPSVFDGTTITKLMETLHTFFSIEKNAEITIECNPGTLNREKAAHYRQAGINRISMGLQSARDEELKLLGRIHTFETFLKNYDALCSTGFDNINIDLMFGLPMQKLSHWEYTLEKTAALAPAHISAYSLIIEEGTPFFQQYGEDCRRREKGEQPIYLPDEDTERNMYDYTGQFLKSQGYLHYEISNYAKPDKACRHNIGYWKRQNYLGLGLGSASLIENTRFSNPRDLKTYLNGCYEPREQQALTSQAQMEEFMFLGLRLLEGISAKEFQETFQVPLEYVYGNTIKKLCSQGLLKKAKDRLALTSRGISVSNYVMTEFLLS